jgi:hypothetical protein
MVARSVLHRFDEDDKMSSISSEDSTKISLSSAESERVSLVVGTPTKGFVLTSDTVAHVEMEVWKYSTEAVRSWLVCLDPFLMHDHRATAREESSSGKPSADAEEVFATWGVCSSTSAMEGSHRGDKNEWMYSLDELERQNCLNPPN